jgi:hypothetical protein
MNTMKYEIIQTGVAGQKPEIIDGVFRLSEARARCIKYYEDNHPRPPRHPNYAYEPVIKIVPVGR